MKAAKQFFAILAGHYDGGVAEYIGLPSHLNGPWRWKITDGLVRDKNAFNHIHCWCFDTIGGVLFSWREVGTLILVPKAPSDEISKRKVLDAPSSGA